MSMYKRPRVLFVCDRVAPGGGPPGYTHNLIRGLDELHDGLRIDYEVWGERHESRNKATGTGRKEQNILARTLSWMFRRVTGLPANLRRAINSVDVVVFQGYQSPARVRYAKRRKAYVLYMPHSPTIMADEHRAMRAMRGQDTLRIISAFLARAENSIIRTAHMTVFASPGASEEYYARLPALKSALVRYLESGVEDPSLSEHVPDGAVCRRTALFVGRYVSHKGYDLFTDAAYELRGATNVQFATLGGGPANADHDNVHNLGWSDDPYSYVQRAGLIVVPNRVAYYDLLPLEAAALGRPVLFTRVGGNVDQASALPDSMTCSIDDLANGIERAFARLDADPDWGRKNREAYEARFTTVAFARRWQDLLIAVSKA